ncbi:alkaline phosphatase D family protein [Pseudoteredinibacter isoporae]|uniref:alkaline phosphatase D family protein n=1 Tax=Pseudoteredinibacter isoporae TaxID=570281 RepID=UPI00310A094A
MPTPRELPDVLAGPILRHIDQHTFTLWLATRKPLQGQLLISDEYEQEQRFDIDDNICDSIQLGQHCFIHLLQVAVELNSEHDYFYCLSDLHEACDAPLSYPGDRGTRFRRKAEIDRIWHGSCRKPHHPQRDAIASMDDRLAQMSDSEERPALLMMSGDQIYADDVAGPTLAAIHQVIEHFGLFCERWEGAMANSQDALLNHPYCYYQREKLLPQDKSNQEVSDSFFRGARKPIFTSAGAHNHLITLAESIAMYLLCWSPGLWKVIDWQEARNRIPEEYLERYDREKQTLDGFIRELPKVQRVLASLPCYMIFDDHDVTDDWNLTRGWEEAAYNNPLSRRIIGNTLIAYWLCQGWGNQPETLQPLRDRTRHCFQADGIAEHEALIDTVLDWEHWHYCIDTKPKVIVLDTRTHRWRSESSPGKPSGLMDWESLSELQQELIGEESVIMVSPAPVFGVKLIEVIQRMFTFFGKPLLVDAENWMAHPGAANVMLNIFLHAKTPPNFIILSGDVHYSFAYDITLRFRKNSPRILQATASGFKNAFPGTLLSWLDRLNRLFYGSRSPLNWFTQRRRMRIRHRRPNDKKSRTLYNQAGYGELLLADNIEDVEVKVHASNGETVTFFD